MTKLNNKDKPIGIALILILALLTGLDAMAIDMYLPGMPALATSFQTTSGRIQQTLSIFLAGLAIGQALYGPLLDRYGRRLPLLAGVLVFVIGSVLAALSPTLEWLLFARFLQALGAAAGLVTPRAIVADLCNLSQASRIFSLLMQVMMIAPIVAPLLGSYVLVLGGSWRLIFWILAGLGLIGFFWGLREIPNSLPPERYVPLKISNIARAYGAQITSPVFMTYTVAGGLILASLFMYISGSAFIFTEYYALSPTEYGYLFAVNSVALVIGGQLSNKLLEMEFSEHKIMYIGILIHTIAGFILYLVANSDFVNLWIYFALLALAIGSLGMVFGNMTALTMNSAGRQVGTASALMGTSHYLLSAIVGYLFSFAAPGPSALPLGIAICGATALLLSLLARRIKLSKDV